jgi:ribosome-associated protein
MEEVNTAAPSAPDTSEALVELAARTLLAKKGGDVLILEVKELCSFADYFIIASGNSRRQVLALAQHLEEALAQAGVKPLGLEGVEEGLWILLDYNTVVVHIFFQPLREFYNLEGLWAEAPRVHPEAATYPAPPSISRRKPVLKSDADPEQISHE